MRLLLKVVSKAKFFIFLFPLEATPLTSSALSSNTQVWSRLWSYLRLAPPQLKEKGSDHQGCIQTFHSLFQTSLSTTARVASLQFQICSLKEFLHPLSLLSPNCPSPLAVCDRPICFSRRQIGRKEIFSPLPSSYIALWGHKRLNISKLQEASPEKNLYCFSSKTALQTIPWWYKKKISMSKI